MIYPLVIVLLLFFSYTYDIITCEGKLNVVYDTAALTTTPFMNTTTTVATTTISLRKYFVFLTKSQSTSIGGSTHMPELILNESKKQCGHVFTTYIIPSLMHFISFVIGFIYFRINENEQLYSLMEKVFLAVNQTLKTVSQDRVIRRLR